MNQQIQTSFSLANPHPPFTDALQKVAIAIGVLGLGLMLITLFGVGRFLTDGWFWTSVLLITVGTVLYAWRHYMSKAPGIKNDGVWFSSLAGRGAVGWALGVLITFFYICLYWYPGLLGLNPDGENTGMVAFSIP